MGFSRTIAHPRNSEIPMPSTKTYARSTYERIRIRKLDLSDLENVMTFCATHINVAQERKSGFRRRLFLSYVFSEPFSLLGEDTFTGSLAETKNGQVIGTILARRFPFGKSWILGPIALHSDFRGSGLATDMMTFTVRLLRKKKAKLAILSVQTSNMKARKFFEKSDFRYLESVFTNHEQARRYVRVFTLISGCFRNPAYETKQRPPQARMDHSDQKQEANTSKTWCIMLKTI